MDVGSYRVKDLGRILIIPAQLHGGHCGYCSQRIGLHRERGHYPKIAAYSQTTRMSHGTQLPLQYLAVKLSDQVCSLLQQHHLSASVKENTDRLRRRKPRKGLNWMSWRQSLFHPYN